MVNVDRLKEALRAQNVTVDAAADALKIDAATMYRRFQRGERFTVAEVDSLAKLLNLSGAEMQSIFFDTGLA